MIGRTLGPYEVLAKLGEGGMGEVYRARDAKLNRDVALKVLPEALDADPDRLARFQREAQVLAQLNHPNIAHIHGFEDADGVHAIVMELVEGPTLADRIAEGALPIEEVLPIARQIAEALEAAHEQGIIHRDLKPANVKVRDDGMVKVLDFGLAKALTQDSGPGAPDSANSPTLTARATQLGMILGTAAYMAPEQARGKAVDRRADVWAFGVVLYEMLTGTRAFAGSDVSETLASVLAREPDWSALPSSVPAPVAKLLRQCLEKDRKERTPDIAVARFAIRDAQAGDGTPAANVQATMPLWRQPALWAIAAAVAIVAGGLGWWLAKPVPEAGRVIRSTFDLPALPGNPTSRIVAISPPGTEVAFIANSQLWIRRLADLEPTLLTPTDTDARTPTYSPGGQEIAYVNGQRLKRVAITGGTPVDIAGPVPRRIPGLHWGDDGFLYVGTDEGIARVPATGGQLEVVIANSDEGRASSPFLLPDSDWLLFTLSRDTEFDKARVVAESLSTHERRVLVEGGYDARVLPSGHLLYFSGGTLFGRLFDRSRVAASGGPVSLVDHVGRATGTATSDTNYGVSGQGDLVYVFRASQGDGGTLSSVDRQGQKTPLPGVPAAYRSLRLSPDGTRIVAAIDEGGDAVDVWLIDVERGARQKLTLDGRSFSPVWSPDGEWVYYTSGNPDGPGASVWRRRADLSGEAERVFTQPDGRAEPYSVSGDGRRLGLQIGLRRNAGFRAAVLDLSDGASPQFLVADAAVASREPALSPDGRFVAYVSEESGGAQVYVQEVSSGRKRVVSVQAAVHPRWTGDGKELIFMNQGRTSYSAVRVIAADRLEFSTPEAVTAPVGPMMSRYDVSRDGTRLIVMGNADGADAQDREVRLVLNWIDEVRAKLPVK